MQGRSDGQGTTQSGMWEQLQGEQQSQSEQLQQVSTRSGQKGSGPRWGNQRSVGEETRRRLGSHLTEQERITLFKVGRCWNCCEKGHRAFKCPSLDKPGYPRKPQAEQLKE